MPRPLPSVRLSVALTLSAIVLSCGGSDGTGVDDGDTIQSVSVSPSTATLDIGATLMLAATVRNRRGEVVNTPLSWSSNPSSVASVTAGLVSGLQEGTAVITASTSGVSGTATITVNDPNPPGAPGAAQATVLSDTSVEVTWIDNSSNEDEFRIEREAVAGAAATAGAARVFTQVGTVGPNTTTFVDTSLDPETGYRYQVLACNGNGCSGPSTPSGGVTTFATLVIETADLPDGVENQPYGATLTASGGDGAVTWSVTGGQLPPPLVLAPATGVLSGTPTTPGDYDFTVQAEGAGQMVTRAYTVTIEEEILPPVVTTTDLPNGVVGEAYVTALAAEEGDGTFAWQVTAGSLPPGLVLAGDGGIAGVPTTAGNFAFTVEVTSAELTGSANLTIDVFGALSVTTAALPSGVLGTPYDQALAAAGGDGDYGWAVVGGGLPDDVALAGDGTLSGTPSATGTFNFTVQVTSGDGQMAQAGLSITINDQLLPPQVTTTSLADGGVGAPYGETLQATDGDGSYSWAVTVGTLPTGLALNPATGEISGTPTTAGTQDITVEVTSAAMTSTADLSITIHPALSVSTTSLPDGVEGQAYAAMLAASGGNADDSWSIESGALPDGLTLATDGTIGGSVAAAPPVPAAGGPQRVTGTFDFTVKVENSVGQSATRALSITVHAPLQITTTTLPAGQVGTPYSQSVLATGGDGTNTWSIASGALPGGLGINPTTGEISGTPGASGTFNFTAQVASGDGQVDQQALSITIQAAAVTVTTTSLADGEVGTAYSQTLQATGGDGSYSWARTAGDPLPAGLALNAGTGEISGTPTSTGTSNFTVEVTSGGQTDDQALSITINAAPVVIETEHLGTAFPGTAYSDFIVASGGDGSYSHAVTAGVLPSGLSLNGSTGEISGTPGTSGAYFFTVTVTSGGNMASKTYAVAISTVGSGGFNMGILNVAGNTIPSAAIITELTNALARWEAVIVGNLGSVTYGPSDWAPGTCSGDGPRVNGATLHDMVIMVNLANIDGPGNTLGSAGPCDARVFSSPVNFATIFGRLTLDTSDLASLDTHQLFSLFFHEIGHIVGVGTLWGIYSAFGGTDLIKDAGTADPRYTGAGGNGVYTGALGGGSSGTETEIPIENMGGPGTADGHWREAEFDHESMTGYSEAPGTTQSISSMTIAAVGDFAYSVDTGAADPYAIPGCAPGCSAAPPPPGAASPGMGDFLLNDILDAPIRFRLPDGTSVVVDPRRSR